LSKRIRFVPQTAAADCGSACLAMTLGLYGKQVALEDVRRVTGLSRHGLDAQHLVAAAEHFGLRARGVQLRAPEDLAFLDPGSILHWEFRHFVVFERAEKKGAWVLDPANGRTFVSRADLDRALTGVALVFEPGPDFERGRGDVHNASILGRYVKRVLQHDAALVRVLLLSVLLQVFSLAVPVLTGVLIDRVLPKGDHQLYWILAAGAATLIAFFALGNFIRAHILLALRTRLDAQLTTDFLEHLVHLPFSFFQQRSTGDLMMRVNSNATIRETLTSSVLSAGLDGLMVATYLVLLLAVDVHLGLVVAGLAVLRVAVLAAAMRGRKRLTAESLQAQAAAQSYELQLLYGIEVLKASGAERRALGVWSNLFVHQLNVSLARGRLDALVNAALLDRRGPLAEAKAADLRALVETNFIAPMQLNFAALPLLQASRGHIFNVSLLDAREVRAGAAAFAASVGALAAYTESLRKDMATHGIRVTLVMVESDAVDAGDAIADALAHPPHAVVNELVVRGLAARA